MQLKYSLLKAKISKKSMMNMQKTRKQDGLTNGEEADKSTIN
jgi:hypothetical protein